MADRVDLDREGAGLVVDEVVVDRDHAREARRRIGRADGLGGGGAG